MKTDPKHPGDDPELDDETSAEPGADTSSARKALLDKALRALLERNPIGQEAIERTMEVLVRVLARREFLERLFRSDFMRHVRDMRSEITETFGVASQADVQEIRHRLDEVLVRLDKLQKTLDEIVVEVDSSSR